MTNEEAKRRLEVWLKCMDCPEDKQCYDSHLHSTCEYTDYCDETPVSEAVKVAIKALEQQPCDNAISRQAVLDTISELNAISFYEAQEDSKECYYEIRQAVKALPPVTPKQKYGKWIVHEKPHGIRYLECPYCNTWYLNEHLIRNSYCPNCGCRMVEPQERSDKE